ncbi:MAG: M16 family metallopeptidase [Sphingomonadales bacterium]
MRHFIKSSAMVLSILVTPISSSLMAQDLTHPRDMNIPKSEFKRPDPKSLQVRLSNGMIAYVAKDAAVPLVNLNAFIKFGKIEGKHEGAAEALADALLNSGPATMSPEDFKATLRAMTADYSVILHNEWTEINLNVPKEDLNAALKLFTELLQSPKITEANIKSAEAKAGKSIDVDENGVIIDANINVAVEKFHEVILEGHILGKKPMSGDFNVLSISDVEAFKDSYLIPNNLTISVSGDIFEGQIKDKIKTKFGKWSKGAVPAWIEVPKVKHEKVKHHYYPADKLQTWVVIGHALPEMSPKDQVIFEVMNYIMAGGHFWTRMFIETRDKYGFTNDASGYIEDHWYGSGSYSFHTSSRHEVTEQNYDNIMTVIYEMQKSLVTDEELMIAKNALADGVFEMRFKDGNATARSFAIEQLRYRNHEASASYKNRVWAVTKEDVLKVAKDFMHPDAFQVIVVGEDIDLQ